MTSAELKLLIDTNYPNNTAGLITPSKERQVLKALVDYVNSSQGEADPIDFIYNPAFTYSAGDPVISGSAWYLSLVDDNLGNDPATNPIEWEPINAQNNVLSIYAVDSVYLGLLTIVVKDGALYVLNREIVGDIPFLSVDFDAELAEEKWKILTGSTGLPAGVEAGLLAADAPSADNFYITLSYLLSQLPDQLIDEGTVTFLSSTSLRIQNVLFLRGGVARVITDQTIPITDNSPTVSRVDIVFATDAETPLYTAGTEDGSQAIPTVTDNHVLIRTLFRNSTGENTQTSPGGGGGGTPNLQQVTNKGNVTSRTIQHAAATTDAQSATLGQVKAITNNKVDKVTGKSLIDDTEIARLAGINDRFKGKYTTLANLQAAHPTANAGDYAQVDTGAANPVQNYNYDIEDGWVIGSTGGAVISNTDELPEGTGNLYFTGARVLATIIAGVSFATNRAIEATDSILVALGLLQKQITDAIASIAGKQDTLVSGTNIKTLNGNSLLGAGNLDLDPDYLASTGNILFDVKRKYGFTTAVTGNLTCGITDAREDVVAKVRHNAGTEPTVSGPGGVTIVKDGGTYVPSTDNTLYLVAHKNDAGTVFKITYMIAK